ncbi:MAG: cation:proton antiporter, partial [Cellulosilyticaceae bacterium]
MNGILFYLAVMIFAGLLFGRLAKVFKLPNVTGYLVGGLIIGPYMTKCIPIDAIENMKIISDMALGFIAFSIGSEFKLSYFKRVGLTPVVIAMMEALLAVICVVVGLLLIGYDLPFALVLGSIAAATAPAATIMVIKQYNAKGPVTETLMSVVALDDAVCLIGFGFAVTLAKIFTGHVSGSVWASILQPFAEVGLSIGVGVILGAIFTLPLKQCKQAGNRLSITIGFIFLAIALSNLLGLSALLTCMAMGAMFVNTCKESESIMVLAAEITPPLYMLFFVASGAELDIRVIPSIGAVGIIYVVFRVIGKISGAYIGAKVMNTSPEVQKYLGFTLVPQAGVAIGLSLMAETVVPQYASVIRAVVLCAT